MCFKWQWSFHSFQQGWLFIIWIQMHFCYIISKQIFIILSGKMELTCVNPFMPIVETKFLSLHYRGNNNYSLQKAKSRQEDSITGYGSCWVRPDWERLTFSSRALPHPSRATAARAQRWSSRRAETTLGGHWKDCFVLLCFVSFFTSDNHISKQE